MHNTRETPTRSRSRSHWPPLVALLLLPLLLPMPLVLPLTSLKKIVLPTTRHPHLQHSHVRPWGRQATSRTSRWLPNAG